MSRTLKRILMASAGTLVLTGAGAFGWYWFETGRFLESTNDAYVKADYTTIAPKVSGYIATVAVEDNQPVKAGQVLARIDDRDFKVSLEQAKAEVEAAEANIANKQAALAIKIRFRVRDMTVSAFLCNVQYITQRDRRSTGLAMRESQISPLFCV